MKMSMYTLAVNQRSLWISVLIQIEPLNLLDQRPTRLMCVSACIPVCCSSTAAKIPVFFVNHPTDSVLTLGCPEARPNLAVAWDQGSTPVYRSKQTKNVPKPRLQIDSGHHLVFNLAMMEDSGGSEKPGQSVAGSGFVNILYLHCST